MLPPDPYRFRIKVQVTPEKINLDFSNTIAALL
ncbi:MAG: hypothetical protein ACI8PW_002126, partial [Methylophilaceae bacterium]